MGRSTTQPLEAFPCVESSGLGVGLFNIPPLGGIPLRRFLWVGGWYVKRTNPWRRPFAPNELLQGVFVALVHTIQSLPYLGSPGEGVDLLGAQPNFVSVGVVENGHVLAAQRQPAIAEAEGWSG